MNNSVQELAAAASFGSCPNFFISGSSYSSMEHMAMELCKGLENSLAQSFTGRCRHFSILVPYAEDSERTMDSFIQRLKRNVCIARSFYDAYRGIVLVEFTEKWADADQLSGVSRLADYMSAQPEICFILLYPEGEKDHSWNMYDILAETGNWQHLHPACIDLDSCLQAFSDRAEAQGMTVPQETAEALKETLKNRSQLRTDNMTYAERLADRLAYERSVSHDMQRAILADEVRLREDSSGKPREKVAIGFRFEP